MGVKELWTVLAPVKEQLPLSALSGKTIAVDLSGWVCQATTIPSPKPHLRQLFVRVCRLCREGVRLVIVLDGEATQLKWGAMNSRAKAAGRGQRSTGKRSMLNGLVRECIVLMDVMGVPYCQSRGEAEALCALLNKEELVHGVFTQDGDAFLYGATVIYKDLSITDFTVDCYKLERVESELGLTRTDLISLGLLIGCDYCPQGVPGIGRAAALRFIAECKPRDSLEVLRSWAGGTEEQSGESKVKRLSRGVIGFPNMDIIREFTSPSDRLPTPDKLVWSMPLVQDIQVFCHRSMEWSFENTCPKAQLLLTQWVVAKQQGSTDVVERPGLNCSVVPVCIVKERKEKKVACFEVKWNADHSQASLASEAASTGACTTIEFTTIEYAKAFKVAYPKTVEKFEIDKHEKQKHKRKPKAKEIKPVPQSPLKYTQTDLKKLTSPPLLKDAEMLSSSKELEVTIQGMEAISKESCTKQPSLESPSKLSQTSLREFVSPPGEEAHRSDVSTAISLSPSTSIGPLNKTSILDITGSDSEGESLMERLKRNITTSSVIHNVPNTTSDITQAPCDTSPPLHITSSANPPSSSEASCGLSPPSAQESRDLPDTVCDSNSTTADSLVVSSDEEDLLPLFSRLGKSPVKSKHISPTKQAKIDSYFVQKKSVPKTTKEVPSNGTKLAPILID